MNEDVPSDKPKLDRVMALTSEFAVQMKCHSCPGKIKDAFKDCEGVFNVEVNFEKGTVVIDSTLPSAVLKRKIESTGYMAVLKGYGAPESKIGDHPRTMSAVAMLGYPIGYGDVKGVVRFVQASDRWCVIEGTIDGLSPGLHGLHIHECGDISKGCKSIGDHYDQTGSDHGGPGDEFGMRHTGDLGNIVADESGRAEFFIEDDAVKLWDVIGRSVAVSSAPDDLGKKNTEASRADGTSGEPLACGIISRSAGLFENFKKICACDGVTIWDERDRPLAGPGRRQPNSSL